SQAPTNGCCTANPIEVAQSSLIYLDKYDKCTKCIWTKYTESATAGSTARSWAKALGCDHLLLQGLEKAGRGGVSKYQPLGWGFNGVVLGTIPAGSFVARRRGEDAGQGGDYCRLPLCRVEVRGKAAWIGA